jgi:hypothetical protein
LTGKAVKVTEVPAHTGFAEAVMVKETGKFWFTVMQIWFEVAGFPVGQLVLEFRLQVIQSPFKGTYIKELLLTPEGLPFTYH